MQLSLLTLKCPRIYHFVSWSQKFPWRRNKKPQKKRAKKSNVVEAMLEIGEDAIPMVDEFVPAAANIDLSAAPNCPPKLMSVSAELFILPQLYTQSSLRSNYHCVHSLVLLI
jgi:hypothetical protein